MAAREPGRPRWWVAGLAAFVVLVSGVLAVLALGGDEYAATPVRPGASATVLDPVGVGELLADLERAIRSGDAAAAEALATPAAAPDVAGVARNAVDLRVRGFSLRFVDQVARTPDGFRAAVDVTWRFAGFDAEPVRTEVELELAADEDGGLSVVGFGGGSSRSPLWLTGRLEVRRAPGVLVLGDPGGEIDAVLRHAARAVPVVRRVLPGWRSGLVVEVPATSADLGGALGADAGEYAGVAAVTAPPDGSLAPGAPLHVFVNPEVLGTLGARGAQVVMSHEATHVATRAPVSTLPLWLLEGFADYVALRDVPLPLRTTAAQVIEQVRRDGPPDALPGPAQFDTGTTHLGAAYEAAWLACLVLAERGGEQALVEFYRSADAGDVRTALRRELGWSVAGLTRAWRARLQDLAT